MTEPVLRVDKERIGPSGVRTVLERCTDPTHRSYSSDKHWDECQMRTHLEAETGAEESYDERTAVGSAIDTAVKAYLLGDEPEALSVLVRRYIKEYAGTIPDERVDKAQEKADRLYRLWYERVRPGWLARGVYAVEWELHFSIGPAIFHVHPDLVFRDGSVDDLKTSEQRLGDLRADFDQQLTAYGFGIYQTFGHFPPRVGLTGLIYANPPADIKAWDPTAEKPWLEVQTSTRTAEQYEAFRQSVIRREASRRYARTTGIYQTQGQTGQLWVCRGCPVHDLCPAWQGTEWPDQKGAKRAA